MSFRLLFSALALAHHLDAGVPSPAIDLTHPVGAGLTIQWPTANKFNFSIVYRGATDGGYHYESNDFAQSEHAGTHLDAPAHFFADRWHTHEIPFHRLMGPACVVDLTEKTKESLDSRLEVDDLLAWEAKHGRIPAGGVVILRSGRSQLYETPEQYLGYPNGAPPNGLGDTKNLHFPGFHPAAAEWLVRNRDIVGVGLDTPSIDYGQSSDFQTHRILSEANIWGLENLNDLHYLPDTGYTVYAMVHKLKDGSGGPARVMALPTRARSLTSGEGTPIASKLTLMSLVILSFMFV